MYFGNSQSMAIKSISGGYQKIILRRSRCRNFFVPSWSIRVEAKIGVYRTAEIKSKFEMLIFEEKLVDQF